MSCGNNKVPPVQLVTTLLTAIVGTSALIVGGVALASRVSKRVHIMLWGE